MQVLLEQVPRQCLGARLASGQERAKAAAEAEAKRQEDEKFQAEGEADAAHHVAVELDPPTSAEGWYALGLAEGEKNGGKACEAEFEPYSRCIALDPKHAGAHFKLGRVLHVVREDYDGAEAMYRKAIELDPTDVLAHNSLERVLKAKNG